MANHRGPVVVPLPRPWVSGLAPLTRSLTALFTELFRRTICSRKTSGSCDVPFSCMRTISTPLDFPAVNLDDLAGPAQTLEPGRPSRSPGSPSRSKAMAASRGEASDGRQRAKVGSSALKGWGEVARSRAERGDAPTRPRARQARSKATAPVASVVRLELPGLELKLGRSSADEHEKDEQAARKQARAKANEEHRTEVRRLYMQALAHRKAAMESFSRDAPPDSFLAHSPPSLLTHEAAVDVRPRDADFQAGKAASPMHRGNVSFGGTSFKPHSTVAAGLLEEAQGRAATAISSARLRHGEGAGPAWAGPPMPSSAANARTPVVPLSLEQMMWCPIQSQSLPLPRPGRAGSCVSAPHPSLPSPPTHLYPTPFSLPRRGCIHHLLAAPNVPQAIPH